MSNLRLLSFRNNALVLFLASNFFFGLILIAIMPPFEGPDEMAHFSRIQSQTYFPQAIVKNKKENDPSPPARRMSSYVLDYFHSGPMPEFWIAFDYAHQGDFSHDYITYKDFFTQPERYTAYSAHYRESSIPASFNPSPQNNWEYQHPPLFYMVSAPLMRLIAGHLSLINATFVLRLWCYIMAFAGIVIAALATKKYLENSGIPYAALMIAAGLLYPFFMPEYFWEFARIGNDGLLLFFTGLSWLFLLQHMQNPKGDSWLPLGLCLAAACYVKAIALPIAAGILCFLAMFHIQILRRKAQYAQDWWQAPLKVGSIVALVVIPIYLGSFLQAGGGGSAEMTVAADILKNQPVKALNLLSWKSILSGIYATTAHAIWIFGTLSELALNFPDYCYRIFYLGIGAIFAYYFLRKPHLSIATVPSWILVFFYLGLIAHILSTRILATKIGFIGGTPGNYLHVIAPCFILIYGYVFTEVSRQQWILWLVKILSLLLFFFGFYIVWSYMTVFAGCSSSIPRDGLYWIKSADIMSCSLKPAEILDHLAFLAYPRLGIVFAVLAFLSFFAGLCCLKFPNQKMD